MANEKLKEVLLKAKTMLKSEQDQDLVNAIDIFTKACDTVPDIAISKNVEKAINKIEKLFKQTTN